jgi:hypothetical protein
MSEVSPFACERFADGFGGFLAFLFFFEKSFGGLPPEKYGYAVFESIL